MNNMPISQILKELEERYTIALNDIRAKDNEIKELQAMIELQNNRMNTKVECFPNGSRMTLQAAFDAIANLSRRCEALENKISRVISNINCRPL